MFSQNDGEEMVGLSAIARVTNENGSVKTKKLA